MTHLRVATIVIAVVLLLVPRASAQYGFTNVDSESITLMAGALGLGTQWPYYNGGDAPAGAYWAFLPIGTNSTSGRITLPRPLTSGQYRLFLQGIDYDQGKSVQASIGTGPQSAAVKLDDRDPNQWWTTAITLDVPAESNVLTLTILRNTADAEAERYLLQGLYLTSNAKQEVDRYSRAITLVYPTTMNPDPAVKGNLVIDGGFEAGVDASWGFAGNRNGLPEWDTTQSTEGQASIKISLDHNANTYGDNMGLTSRVYHLKPNTRYTASAMVRASSQVAVTFQAVNAYTLPPGYTEYPPNGEFIYADPTWRQMTATFYALDYPSPDYQLKFFSNEVPGGFLWIDAVQLEEGDRTPYQPASTIVAGVQIRNRSGNVFWETEPITATLVARNYGVAATATLRYEIRDYMGRLVKEGPQALALSPQATQEMPFSVATGKRGIFRLVTWLEGVDRSEKEIVYAIIPRPAVTGLDPSSIIGVHPQYTEAGMMLNEKLGIKWARAMSPSGFFRWSIVEPVEGQIVFYDTEINHAIAHGVTTLGTIGTNNYWPAWADVGGLPNLAKWASFCSRLASHYQNSVLWWEIWNEPHSVFTPDFYAQLLKTAVDAIEVANPNAKIVGMGGTPRPYMESVLLSLESRYPGWDWKQHIDVVSTHAYDGGYPPEAFSSTGFYNVPTWNTETGYWDRGFYQGPTSSFSAFGKNLWPYADAVRYYDGAFGSVNAIVKNFLRSASVNQKYFYYDARTAASPELTLNHTTMVEADGTVRAKGIGYAIAGALVDHATGLGDVVTADHTTALLFDKPQPIAALFSTDNRPRLLSWTLPSASFEVLDMMGNPISGLTSGIPYGRIPVYVRGLGITAGALRSALEAATLTDRQDTTPPTVSISDGPRGPIQENSFRVRWIAIDDTSYPNTGEITPETIGGPQAPDPDALQYAYALDNVWSLWSAKTFADFSGVAGGNHTFTVKAKDAAGNESQPATRSITIGAPLPPPPPPAPTLDTVPPLLGSITTTPFTRTTVTLTWLPATDDVTPQPHIQYAAYRSSQRIYSLAQAEAAQQVMPYTANVTTFTVTGLPSGTTAYFAVIARDQAGNKAGKFVQRKTRN